MRRGQTLRLALTEVALHANAVVTDVHARLEHHALRHGLELVDRAGGDVEAVTVRDVVLDERPGSVVRGDDGGAALDVEGLDLGEVELEATRLALAVDQLLEGVVGRLGERDLLAPRLDLDVGGGALDGYGLVGGHFNILSASAKSSSVFTSSAAGPLTISGSMRVPAMVPVSSTVLRWTISIPPVWT